MTRRNPPPNGIDSTRPNVARIYDYLLGGKDNFAADREAARQLLAVTPDMAGIVRDNRSFIGRVVRYLAGEAGIRQFLDLGGGLPTQTNVHEMAQRIAPDARVAYIDNDPVVCSHGQALLAHGDQVAMVRADLRDPAEVPEALRARGDDEKPEITRTPGFTITRPAVKAISFISRRRWTLAGELVVDAALGGGQRVAGAAPAELDQFGGHRDRGLLRGPGAEVQPDRGPEPGQFLLG